MKPATTMYHLAYELNGETIGGCYPLDMFVDKLIGAVRKGAANIEWGCIPPAPPVDRYWPWWMRY